MSPDASPVLLLWLATYALHSCLLLGAAWLFERLRSNTSPAVREALWRTAMVGAILTATLQTSGVLPPLSGAIPVTVGRDDLTAAPLVEPLLTAAENYVAPIDSSPEPEAAAGRAVRLDDTETARRSGGDVGAAPADGAFDAVAGNVDGAASDASQGGNPTSTVDWGRVVLLAWLAGALVLTGRLLSSVLVARSTLRDRKLLLDGALADRVRSLARGTRLRHVPRVSTSSRITGPITLPSGEICIPDWVDTRLEPSVLDAILAHEMAHGLRRDALWQVIGLAVHSVLFFQPLNGVARKRLTSLAELAADDWAASQTGNGQALAEGLATFGEATRLHEPPIFAAAMIRKPGAIVERVQRLLAGRHQSGIVTRRQQVAIGISAILVASALPGVMAQSPGTDTLRASSTDNLLACLNPDVLHGLVMRDGELVVSLDRPPEMSFLATPAELDWIASAARSTSTTAAFRSALAPEAALSAAMGALEQDGWTTQPFNTSGGVFSPPVQVLTGSACQANQRVSVTTRPADGGSYLTYGFKANSAVTGCGPANSAGLAGPFVPTPDDGVQAYMPTLQFPPDPASGRAAITEGNRGGGSTRSRYNSTTVLLDMPIVELASVLSRQIAEQGWVADASWSGAVTAGSSWSRQPSPEIDLAGTLELVETGDSSYTVMFRIVQLEEGI